MHPKEDPKNTAGQILDKSTNTTAWMKDAIINFLSAKGYKIILFNINAEILARFDKITIINTFSIKMSDKDGKLVSLNDYCSTNKEYDDTKLKWFIDFVKEREMEAILKFGGSALGTENIGTPKCGAVFKVEGEKKFGNLEFDIFFCSTIDEIIKFISASGFYQMWMGPSLKETDGTISFENILIKNLKAGDGTITLDYKWVEWNEYSQVKIDFVQVGDNVKVALHQSHIPIDLVDCVKMHWVSRIFGVISNVFRCAIKLI